MFLTILITIKRLSRLLPGLLVAYFASQELYPLFNSRLPAVLATLLTYILAAYVVIPALIRFIRLFYKSKHLPHYCTTPDGFASDPVNIAVVGSLQQLTSAMSAAGWHQADERTPASLMRAGLSILLKRHYPTAPFSNLYLFGRRQDIGFQIQLDNNPAHRHHVRFWGLIENNDPKYLEHALFWRRHHEPPAPGKILWLGAASKDIGFGIIRHNAQLTHMIHPDTDAERDLILNHLKQARKIKRIRKLAVTSPHRLTNRVINGWLQSDGVTKLCELKD